MMKCNLVYFSATGNTAQILSALAERMGAAETTVYNITWDAPNRVDIPQGELAVFGFPVFAGRLPRPAADRLARFCGNGGPALVVCTYGNREFDDALLELSDLVEKRGFRVVSAAAFVARHSIFPKVGYGRPDIWDGEQLQLFAAESVALLSGNGPVTPPSVRGNRPFREASPIPLRPRTRRSCNGCGLCASQCPVQAIDHRNPRRIDGSKCLSCAHCIAVCPRHAKHFGGLLYGIASRKFRKKCAERKEPYLVFGSRPPHP